MPKPNRAKYYEKLREKRRLTREKAQKVQEEKKRAREMKEDKWTVRNEFGLISEHRKVQRTAYVEKIRKEGQAMLESALARVKENEKREMMIQKEIEEELEAVKSFVGEQCNYYDEIHKQISPPKERSVDEIVAEIEKELKQIYDIFSEVFNFDPKMPEEEEQKEDKDPIFAKEIAQLEKEFAENTIKCEKLEEEIGAAKVKIETENVRYAAIEQQKSEEILGLERKIKKMEVKLAFLKQDPVEVEEVEKLRDRVEEEKERNKRYADSLRKIKELIEKKKEEEKKKKSKSP